MIIFSLTDWGQVILRGRTPFFEKVGLPPEFLRNLDLAPLISLDEFDGVALDRWRWFLLL